MKSIYRFSLALALAVLYLMALGAPFISPYSHKEQFRDFFYAPPTSVHFRDTEGNWHTRPFIYEYEMEGPAPSYRQTSRPLPVYFFVEGTPYQWLGMTWRTHLFGLQDTDRTIFLMGSDGLGRDLFSRILYGSQFSLTIGVAGILLTGLLGLSLGSVAGYFAGWFDVAIMRLADLFLSLPGLFVVLGLRALFPVQLPASSLYWLIVLIFSLIGWASVTRVIRGQVVSLKTREYVLAAQASGASHRRVLLRHILPFTSNYLVVQSMILIPAYILGEITLSFLGVGVQEPDASWGTLLNAATSLRVLTHYPWLLWPAAFVFITVLCFNLLGDELKSVERQRTQLW
ncbi:MAG: ABC transporter permease [Acidobacteriota bacterium]